MGYPAILDEAGDRPASLAEVMRHAGRTLSASVRRPRLRRLFLWNLTWQKTDRKPSKNWPSAIMRC